MRFKFWRKKAVQQPYMPIGASTVDKVVRDLSDKFGREYCLNIGAGSQIDANFQTLDIDSKYKPDYVADIRVAFAASDYFRQRANEYPDLSKLQPNQFMLIWEQHTAEHIEWIYQQTHFQWLYTIIAPGGCLVIEVPNLEFIAKVYITNLDRQKKGDRVRFPAQEHGDLRETETSDMQRWINFKLFSGCSPGDYHHTCFDAMLLWKMMNLAGFEKVSIWNGTSLKAVAYKPSAAEENLSALIESVVGGISG
jgi:predicted SAM-dependent methyltransferase